MGEWIRVFLTSTVVGGDWSASPPGRFTPGTNWIGSWVDPTAGLDYMENCSIPDPSVVQAVASRYTDCATAAVCNYTHSKSSRTSKKKAIAKTPVNRFPHQIQYVIL
jgi:hypothetical protein